MTVNGQLASLKVGWNLKPAKKVKRLLNLQQLGLLGTVELDYDPDYTNGVAAVVGPRCYPCVQTEPLLFEVYLPA